MPCGSKAAKCSQAWRFLFENDDARDHVAKSVHTIDWPSATAEIRTAIEISSLFSTYEIKPQQPGGIQGRLARLLLYRGRTFPSPDERAIVFAWISRLMAALERWLAVRPQESRSTPHEPDRAQSLEYDSYIRANTGPDKESDVRL